MWGWPAEFAVTLVVNACSSPARNANTSGAYDWTGFYAGVNAGATIDAFRLGVNYKFDFLKTAAAQQ